MKSIARFILFICFISLNIYSFSGNITHDTLWSTDVILTGDVIIDSTVTLNIKRGTQVRIVRIDNNADGIGDIRFIVNGNLRITGTGTNCATFISNESPPQRNDWEGIIFASTNPYTGGLSVSNANIAIHVQKRCSNLILDRFSISNSNTGVFIDSSNNAVYLYNFVIDTTRVGAFCSNSANLSFNNIRILRSDSVALSILNSSIKMQYSQIDSNKNIGAFTYTKNNGYNQVSFSYCNFCNNGTYGFYAEDSINGNISYSNFIHNGKSGIYIKGNKVNTLTFANSNIYQNSTLNDTLLFSGLQFLFAGRYDQYLLCKQFAWYKLPSFIDSISIKYYFQNNTYEDAVGFNNTQGDVFFYDTGSNYHTSGVYNKTFSLSNFLRNDSILIHFTNCNVYDTLLLSKAYISHKYQFIYLTKSFTKINSQGNYWGQLSRIDTLIGTQSLVQWSNFQTSIISTAGYQPGQFTPNIVVSPLTYNFNNVPLNFSDSLPVIIENTGDNILVCEDISSGNSVFISKMANLYIIGRQKDTIYIKFQPDSIKTETGYLSIPTNVAGKEIMQVLLQGAGVPANQAPQFSSLMPDTLLIAGTTLSRPHSASDPNTGDALIYSVVSGPAGLSYNSGVISWAIPLNAVNSTVRVKATDPYGLFACDTFTLSINHPPQITSLAPDSNLTVGTAYTYDVNATDQDGDNLSYTLDSLIGTMSISQTSGLIAFTPSINDTGRFTIKVRVTDVRGAFTAQSYHVLIRKAVGTIQSLSVSPLPTSFSIKCIRQSSGLSLRFAIPPKNNNDISSSRKVSIKLFNLQGQLLTQAIEGDYLPGYYSVNIGKIFSNSPKVTHMESEGYSTTMKSF
jgi:hypothetical protein